VAETSKPNYFKSVSRLQYRMSLNGESGFSQGTFLILPHGFTLAELVELLTTPHDDSKVNFNDFDLEIKLARYFQPSTDWGKAFGWVARVQSVSGVPMTAAGGLQWNITDTPGIKESTNEVPWKSLLQVFVKNRDRFGLVDIYHWYQFPLAPKNALYLRGANVAYLDDSTFFSLMQDVIYPINSKVELFARHSYQNKEMFGHRNGSQFGVGVRMAY
jgi:hypothetical protein